MINICFTHEFTMMAYVHASYDLHPFVCEEENMGDGAVSFKSDNINAFFCSDEFLRNDYHKIKNDVDIFVGWTEVNKSFKQDSIKDVRKFLSKDTKFLIFDDIGEYSFEFDRNEIYKFVDDNPKNYLITQRYTHIEPHERILNNQAYLPFFYYYFDINDLLYYHPPLPDFDYQRLKDYKYDYLCYLGKDANIENGKPWRGRFVDRIDFKDKKLWKPSTFHGLSEKHKIFRKYVERTFNTRFADYGQYMLTSTFESLEVKVKLVFESFQILDEEIDVGYDSFDEDQQFLTEKTLKCFLYTQPYILILNKISYDLLKEFGFRFPFPSYHDGLIDFINELNEGDNLEKWIKTSAEDFKHNKKQIYKLLSDNTLPFVKFFEKMF